MRLLKNVCCFCIYFRWGLRTEDSFAENVIRYSFLVFEEQLSFTFETKCTEKLRVNDYWYKLRWESKTVRFGMPVIDSDKRKDQVVRFIVSLRLRLKKSNLRRGPLSLTVNETFLANCKYRATLDQHHLTDAERFQPMSLRIMVIVSLAALSQ